MVTIPDRKAFRAAEILWDDSSLLVWVFGYPVSASMEEDGHNVHGVPYYALKLSTSYGHEKLVDLGCNCSSKLSDFWKEPDVQLAIRDLAFQEALSDMLYDLENDDVL
jgi:hypothetical protein